MMSRQHFETWATEQGFITKWRGDDYEVEDTRAAWAGFQAGQPSSADLGRLARDIATYVNFHRHEVLTVKEVLQLLTSTLGSK